MSAETLLMLQSIINSMSKPAYIELDGRIVMSNNLYSSHGYDESKTSIKGKALPNGFKICELVDNDIHQLQSSSERLRKASALL